MKRNRWRQEEGEYTIARCKREELNNRATDALLQKGGVLLCSCGSAKAKPDMGPSLKHMHFRSSKTQVELFLA